MAEGNVLLARRSSGPVELVSLAGTLDAWSEPDVRTALKAVLAEGRRFLVLDVSGLKRIDSTGLSAFLSVLKAARAAEGDVVLLRPSTSVLTVLRLTRLDQILESFDDEGAALGRLTS